MGTATNEDGVSVVMLLGYEIVDMETGKHVSAVLFRRVLK